MREKARLERGISAYRKIENELNDSIGLIEMGDAEGDQAIVAEAEAAIARLREEAAKRELETLLSGEADGNDAYLEVHSGAGGTEAQDWAEMLLRMYARWAEAHRYKVEWIEESAGEGAGLKSATIRIVGEDAYGWLKTESGVHRLVRISPFDANARRQTSFASVWVYPVVDDKIEVTIDEKYLRTDTYRSSGAGGQHVNKTDSAVRLTYQPPGTEPVVVACQSERSQHQNRAHAMAMLKARLYEIELQKREAATAAINAGKTDIGWGHQIRSYVLQPYQMVKDVRTGVETGNPNAVLDGDIDRFLEAALAARIKGVEALQEANK
jgi:peptide chain release factor 2